MFSILYRYPFRCSLSLIDILFDVLYSQRYLLSMFFAPNRFLHLNRYLIGCSLPPRDILFDVLYPLKISYSMIYTLNRYLIRCSSVPKRYYIRLSKSSRDILFDFLYSQVIFLYPQWMFKSVFYTSVCVLYPKQISLSVIDIYTYIIPQTVIYPLQAS